MKSGFRKLNRIELRVADGLSDSDLDRLCDLIELLDRWDREDRDSVAATECAESRTKPRAPVRVPKNLKSIEGRHTHA